MRRLATGLALLISIVAQAAPSRNPDLSEFMRYCREHREQTVTEQFEAPRVGSISFLPTAALQSNQGRFSWASTKRKLRQTVEDDAGAYGQKKNGEWVLANNRGTSFYPREKAIRGIYYRGKIFIVDGHHRALISTYLGAETIPVHIIANLSRRFTPEQLTEYMAKNDYSYFLNYQRQKISPVDLCDMQDDPNLELARSLIARVDVTFKNGQLVYGKVRGKAMVIGIKTDEDIPFLEIEVADALRRAGVEWQDEFEHDFSKKELEDFLVILGVAAYRNANSRLRKVLLFDKPTRVADLDLHDALLAHLQDLGCEKALRIPQP
ncbi:MAG: ParB-like protein [Bdellovibrionales bacterium]